MILIAYDGSPDSQAAVEQAGALFPGQSATIVTIWEPFVEMMARTGGGIGMVPGLADTGEIDAAYEQSASERAAEGAQRARAVGLDADSQARSRETSVADAILAAAADLDAQAIVMGSRGLGGIKSVLLGSVSRAVLHHADRPVVVVPSAAAAAEAAGT